MSIYQIDTTYVSEQLTPPKLRGVKLLAWLQMLLKPLSILFDINFLGYKLGSSDSDYSGATTYTFGNRVRYTDKSIYELIVSTSTGIDPTNTTNWIKINDVFIGCDERVKYNAQKLLFEYALNKFFLVPIVGSQIYIDNVTTFVTPFVMGNTGTYSSSMPTNSINQINFLGNAYNYTSGSYDYTIYVPTAIYTALGTDATNRENAVRNFADNYNLAGLIYEVVAY